jgi:hypothetical protein
MDSDRGEQTGEQAGRRTLEYLLGLTSAKTDKLEKDLEATWIAHVVVAGIGIAMVFNVGHVAEAVVGGILKVNYDLKTVAPILLAIHLYYFMRTGPLLTEFNEAKKLRDGLLDDYSTGQLKGRNVEPLRATTSFLANAFHPHRAGIPYFIITTLFVSLAQASALFLVYTAYHTNAIVSLVIAIVAMIVLYSLFWKAQRAQEDHTLATWAVAALSVLVLLWLCSFTILTLGKPHQ